MTTQADRKLAAKLRAEQREFHLKKRQEAFITDLRDETISIVLGSRPASQRHAAFQECYEAGGATVQTLEAWFEKKVTNPQGPTIRATLRAMGKDIGIVELRETTTRKRRA